MVTTMARWIFYQHTLLSVHWPVVSKTEPALYLFSFCYYIRVFHYYYFLKDDDGSRDESDDGEQEGRRGNARKFKSKGLHKAGKQKQKQKKSTNKNKRPTPSELCDFFKEKLASNPSLNALNALAAALLEFPRNTHPDLPGDNNIKTKFKKIKKKLVQNRPHFPWFTEQK